MESANFHHLQDQLVGSSSSLATSSFYGLGTTHAWIPNTILNTGNFDLNVNGDFMNSRNSSQQNDIPLPTTLSSSMIQDLGFYWQSTSGSFTGQSTHDLHFQRIKEEFSDSYPKFTEMINSPSSSIEELQFHPTSYIKNEQREINGLHLLPGEFYSRPPPSRGFFSQILPTINVSNFNQQSSKISSPMEMNLQALDLFNSTRFNGIFGQSQDNQLDLFEHNGLHHTQQSSHRPSNCPNMISPFTNGVTEAKRSSCVMEPKAPQSAHKKSRVDSRSSSAPFKVRKEKLGDRIAALQQLVAPFGKTDTASVLMEAIGYIKFLQNQIETLSVPYMKSSRNNTSRTMEESLADDENEESKPDLRSQGLCLVPLAYLSYVTDGGGGVWPPHNFG